MEPSESARALVTALKKAIANSELTKVEIARRTGISRQTIQCLNNPGLTTLFALCRVLKLKLTISRLK